MLKSRRDNILLRHDSLLKLIIEGYVDGKTERPGREYEYIPPILKDMRMKSYRELKELSFD